MCAANVATNKETDMLKTWVVSVACVLALSACNTINGLGKDLEKAGEAVQKSTK